MKSTIHSIYLLILLYSLSACSQKENDSLLPELTQAEEVMYQYPDSALHILERMPIPKASDRLQNATWCLLTTQAKYKNYVEQSDSLINIAYNYFINKENLQRKAMVLYFKGISYMELQKVEEAMKYFLDATTIVEKTDDYQLAHLVYTELGFIYIYREIYEYATNTFQKAYQYAELSGNKKYACSSLNYLAKVCSAQSDFERAIKYYKSAIKIAEEIEYTQILTSSMNSLAGIYTRTQNYHYAISYAKKSLEIKRPIKMDMEQSFLVLGNIYRTINKKDSARYYFKKALKSTNIYTLQSTYQGLYYLSKEEKDFSKSIKYIELFMECKDTIEKRSRHKELIEMQEKYNQEKVINEKNLLKMEKDQITRNGLIILVTLLCLVGVVIFVYQRKLIRKERAIQKNEEELHLLTIKLHEKETQINRNQRQMNELTAQIGENKDAHEQWEEQRNMLSELQWQNEALQQEKQTLQNKISEFSQSLNEQTKEWDTLKNLTEENQRLQEREKFLCNHLIKRTQILNDLKLNPKFINEAHWEEIKETIDHLFDNYTQRLNKQFPTLTDSDLQICCLIKLHLGVSDIATLLAISPTSVSKRKQRLKECIIQETGPLNENQNLDLWLWEY